MSQWRCVTSRIVLRALKQIVLKTHQDKQDNFTKLVGISSLTNTVVGYHGLRVTVVLVVTQNALQLPGRRSYRRFRPRPLAHCAMLAFSYCMRSQPRCGTPQQAHACSRSSRHWTSLCTVIDCPDTQRILPPRRARSCATCNSVGM